MKTILLINILIAALCISSSFAQNNRSTIPDEVRLLIRAKCYKKAYMVCMNANDKAYNNYEVSSDPCRSFEEQRENIYADCYNAVTNIEIVTCGAKYKKMKVEFLYIFAFTQCRLREESNYFTNGWD